jgi:hypothetical protein
MYEQYQVGNQPKACGLTAVLAHYCMMAQLGSPGPVTVPLADTVAVTRRLKHDEVVGLRRWGTGGARWAMTEVVALTVAPRARVRRRRASRWRHSSAVTGLRWAPGVPEAP